jgi:hypothetical protein
MPEVSSGSHNARDLYAYSVMLWRLLELRLFPRYENQAFGLLAIQMPIFHSICSSFWLG